MGVPSLPAGPVLPKHLSAPESWAISHWVLVELRMDGEGAHCE